MDSPVDTVAGEIAAREEGFLHYIAREGRIALRWTIGVCLIAVVACMVSPLWMAAVVPALIMLGAYILLLLANEVERRSDTAAHRQLERAETAIAADVQEDHAEDDQLPPVDAAIVRRESKTGLLILAGVVVMAVLIAGLLVPWKALAIGAFVVFAYILFIAAPFWLGLFNDDIEIESHRLEDLPEPASVKTTE